MTRIHSIALLLTLAAAGCSGHSPATSMLPNEVSVAGTLSALPAAKITVPASANRLHKQDWGGIPTMGAATVMDAPPLLGGAEPTEIDLAIVRIDAVGDSGSATLAQFDTPYVANILDFQTQPLAFDAVPIAPGNYTHLQVIIDAAQSHVVLNGNTLPINFANSLFFAADELPAALTDTAFDASDVVMDVASSINAVAGQTNTFNIDFNAAESLALSENGSSVDAKPVLAAAGGNQGSLAGRIVNGYGGGVAHAIVVAHSNNHAANSTITDASGNFYIHTIQPGAYRIKIYNQYKNAAGNIVRASGQTSSQKDIRGPRTTVQAGAVTNVGNITD